jgi:N-ethylmaleimide reductase
LKLLQPITLGDLVLKNRVFMAPLTRCRAKEGRTPHELNRIYYNQRSSAGLIITEATIISPQGAGYVNTPGIYSQEQIDGWGRITNSVNKRGGHMFCQIWHCGRSSHSDFHEGKLPVSPSAVENPGKVYTPLGIKNRQTPRALELDEIPQIVNDFIKAAQNSIDAGFAGVEIHGANGYLIDQFICDETNKREDNYGGSIENRIRFALDVVKAVGNKIGFGKTAIRLSPNGTFNNMYNSNPQKTFATLLKELDKLNLAYVHVTEHYNPPGKNYPIPDHYLKAGEVISYYRQFYKGTFVGANGFNRESGEKLIQDGNADAVAYGKWFLANPDLPKRFEEDAELNMWDVDTFYGENEKGYIDYPFLTDQISK